MNKQASNILYAAGIVLSIALMGAAVYGYVMNIIYLVQTQVFSGLAIFRAVGIFMPPVGAILGFVS